MSDIILSGRRPNVASRITFPNPSCFGLCSVDALLRRIRRAQNEVDGPIEAHRAIATLHSFRFFGLVFVLPGVVGPNLPASFATFAAYGDFATGLLAMMALHRTDTSALAFRGCQLLRRATDIILDYYHAIQAGLPALAGQLGSTYAIPVIYVPLLMITHSVAFYWMLRPQSKAAPALVAMRPILARISLPLSIIDQLMTDTTAKVRKHYRATDLTSLEVGVRDITRSMGS